MPTYDLGLKHSYVPHWDVWEGVREFVQNYLDGMSDHFGSMRGSLRHTGSHLVLTNEETKLERSAWIMGQTSKANRADQRGQWGDGLKTGSLALIRAGVDVVMDNGCERWTPTIQESAQFGGVETLHVKIRKLRKERNHFQARIAIDKETWNALRANFLAFCDETTTIEVHHRGTILTDESMAGRIYARGIFVTTDAKLDYGYDFTELELDRDRGRVASWELDTSISNIESAALCDGLLDSETMYLRMANGQHAMEQVARHIHYEPQAERVYSKLAERFLEEHGEDARPVADLAEQEQLSYVGRRGVVVSEALGIALEHHFGEFAKIRTEAINSSGCELPVNTLLSKDQAIVRRAVSILELADCVNADQLYCQLKIWSFDGEGSDVEPPLGIYIPSAIAPGVPEIRINTSELASLPKFLGTLIHEIAHDYGSDGTLAHRTAEEAIWQKVTAVMLDFLGEDFLD